MCGGCEDCAAVDPAKPHIAWEYHATVANEKWDDFQLFCDANGIKAIRVEDLFKDGSTRISMMTSQKIVAGSIGPALTEYYRVYDLINDNFETIRNKVEVAPWCAGVPRNAHDFVELCHEDGDAGYFEVHFQFNDDTPELHEKLWKQNLRLSRNVGKPGVLMATYRHTTWLDRFERGVEDMKKKLKKLPLDKRVIIEYTIHDTNLEYDTKWSSESTHK